MSRTERGRVTWRTSSYTADQGNCVEIGWLGGDVLVRDTKNRTAGALRLPANAWHDLQADLRTPTKQCPPHADLT